MIGDLCRPINDGESRTVRIVMLVDEARALHQALRLVSHDDVLSDLFRVLVRAIEREEDVVRREKEQEATDGDDA